MMTHEAREDTQQEILSVLKEMRNLLVEVKDLLDDGLPSTVRDA